VAGIIDVIKANQTGYLVEPWDVRGLADITRGLLGEASGARPVVESAHRAALEQFTPERMVQQYAAILERAPSLRGAGDPGQ
jgi:glycosyltransferase involved in cell wall biosynthesis